VEVNDPVDVLLVEDNAADEELTLRGLHQSGVTNRIWVVRDGAEALDFIFATGVYSGRSKRNRPRVILLDIKLPEVNGIAVLRSIRGDPEAKDVPVVLLTSSDSEMEVVRGYQEGANSYIVKPVDPLQWDRVMRQLGIYWVGLNQPPPDEASA
jgi:two-component system response regulator